MPAAALPPVPSPFRETLRETAGGRSAAWPLVATPDDDRAFSEAMALHGMAPMLYQRAAIAGAAWPASVLETLRSAALLAAAAEPLRLQDLALLLEAFQANALDVLVIKGSALAHQIYPTPEQRPRADTDLLVRRSEAERARALLRSLGYAGRVTSGDPLANRQQAFARVDPFGIEHVYDLHWDVANTPVVRDVFSFEELWSRAVPVPALSPHAFAPSLPDALLLACVHRAAHHHDSERLIWLYDIFLLAGLLTDGERAEFRRQAERRGVSAICARSLVLSEEWFAPAVNDWTSRWNAEAMHASEPSARFLDRSRRQVSVLAEDLRALGWRERLQRIRDLAFPPAEYMRASFPSASPLLLPTLYVVRGVRGVARLFRRVQQSKDAT